MKKNLGKIIFFILFTQTVLFADKLATYTLSANKYKAMVKEPIVITFEVTQKDPTDHMFFLLTAKKSEDYEIKLLKSLNDDSNKHHSKASFKYLLFPLKAKTIEVKFNFTIQTASDKALAQSYVDDHDGGKAIEKINHVISLKALKVNVKELPKGVDLFGDFTLHAQCDKQTVSPYEDINILYTLKGEGYKNEKLSLLQSMPGVTLFKDIRDSYMQLTKNGYKSKRLYTYALSSTDNFEVPALHLVAYSFSKHKKYVLVTPPYKIQVKKIDPKTLLDTKDAPKITYFFSMKTIKTYFTYIMLFLFGFISAKVLDMNFKKGKKRDKLKDIKEAQTPQQLILILLNKYRGEESKYFIKELEKIAYKQSSLSFSKIKKEILQYFSK